ncbi:MAG: hypothetical protein U0165_16370 [Polyangiaceae bacterium]
MLTSTLRRYLEGWQPAAVAVLIATLGVALAAPRPVVPDEVVSPFVDGRALAATMRLEITRAQWLERLSDTEKATVGFEARRVGDEVRRYGRLDAQTPATEMPSPLHETTYGRLSTALAVDASQDPKPQRSRFAALPPRCPAHIAF